MGSSRPRPRRQSAQRKSCGSDRPVSKGKKKLACETCGRKFDHVFGAGGGRPPRHCPEHRKATGPKRDLEGNAKRKKARAASKRAAAAGPEANAHVLYELAAALSVFPDPETAAAFVGIGSRGEALEELVASARGQHEGVIGGDPGELARRLTAVQHMCVARIVRDRDLIAPRDHPHVMRALAQVAEMSGAGQQTRFAHVTLQVVGADGIPFEPAAGLPPPTPDDAV
jgi:hypothetical protein